MKEELLDLNLVIEYTYDSIGNLVSRVTKNLKDNSLVSDEIFEYKDELWKNQLTKYNDTFVTYDSIGNPLTIGNNIAMTWQNGKMLKSYVDSEKGLTIDYKYDSNGIRLSKVVNGVETKYYLEQYNIIYEECNGKIIYYLYDPTGLIGLEYDGKKYYYIKNIQSDIVGILDENNKVIVKYKYNSWGKMLSITDSTGVEIVDSNNIGIINPFRYRGYYYDKETDRYVSIGLDKARYAKFNFSRSLKEDICNMIREAVKVATNSNNNLFSVNILEKNNFIIGAKKTIEQIFEDDFMLLYIPAGRNLLTILPDGIVPKEISLSNHYKQDNEVDISQTDLITQEFAQYIRDVRSRFGSKLDEIIQNYLKTVKGQIRNQDVDLARQLIHEILHGDYVYDKDGEKLYYDKEHWVKLMFSSSGQQEIVWALNIIFLEILKNEKTFLVFEEPESHLFPDSQEKIAQLTALLINSSNSQVVITTHSPYMLTAFNLLIYSGEKEKRTGAEDSVIRKEFRMAPKSVGAYFISAEIGCLKNIVSETRGLIDALQIDGISESINERMDRILYNDVDNRRQK